MRIYIYSECCMPKGQVAGECTDDQAREIDECSPDDQDSKFEELTGFRCPISDCVERNGTREELIAEARESLNTRYDKSPRGTGDHSRWECDRSILKYFGESE